MGLTSFSNRLVKRAIWIINMVNARPVSIDSNAIKMINTSLTRATVSLVVNCGLRRKNNPTISRIKEITAIIPNPITIIRCLRSSGFGTGDVGGGSNSVDEVSIAKYYTIATKF
jgi:hypothetical protein